MPTYPALRNPAWLRRNATTAVPCPVYNGVSLVSITSGTCTLYDHTGASHSTPTVTVSGGVASAACVVGTHDPSRGWRLELALSDSTTTYHVTMPAVVVRNAPACPVSSDDVTKLQPRILGTPFPGSQTSWDPQIDLAFAEVCSELLQATGVTLDRVTDTSVLFPLVLRRAGVLALQIAQGPTGKAAELAVTLQAEYSEKLRLLSVQVDDDGDGVADRARSAASSGFVVDGRVG